LIWLSKSGFFGFELRKKLADPGAIAVAFEVPARRQPATYTDKDKVSSNAAARMREILPQNRFACSFS
jgi:hypothetical protein